MQGAWKIFLTFMMCVLFVTDGNGSAKKASFQDKYSEYIDKDAIVLTVDTSTSDISANLKTLLETARDDKKHSYVIVIPEGKYVLSAAARVYSNTTIYAVGAELTRSGTGVSLCTGGLPEDAQHSGYSDYQNINVIGGKWIRKQGNYSNVFYFIHGTNVNVIDCVLDGSTGEKKENNHLIEASAIDGLTVKGCTFKNNVRPAADIKNDTYCGGWECLQLDITADAGEGHNYKYDGTPSKNVLITENTFTKASRGIGSHTAIDGVYIENIVISNNTFDGLTDEAIVAYHYYNCKIVNNTINGGRGICVQNMGKANTSKKIGTYFLKPAEQRPEGVYTAKKRTDVNTVVSGNTIVTSSSMKSNCSYGIEIYGASIPSGFKCVAAGGKTTTLPKGNYEISNVTVTNNDITTNGVGIRARGCFDSVISNNTINPSKDAVKAKTQVGGVVVYGGAHSATKGVTVKDNRIGAFRDGGILVKESSYAQDITGNTIKNSGGDGIRISDKGIVLGSISKNTIASIKGQGISVKTKGTVKNIKSNKITSAKGAGILISDNGIVKGSIDSNTMKSCGECGIDIKSSKISKGINANTITESTNYGIRIVNIQKPVDITSNTITKVKKAHAVYIRNDNSKHTVKIVGNKITGNKKYFGIRVEKGKLYIKGNTISKTVKPVSCFQAVKGEIFENTIKGNTDNRYALHVDKGTIYYVNNAAVKKVKAKASGKLAVNVSWKPVSKSSGYKVEYATKADMSNAKSSAVDNKKSKKLTLTKLKAKKTYYITVRSYLAQDGLKVYSKPSTVIKCQTK